MVSPQQPLPVTACSNQKKQPPLFPVVRIMTSFVAIVSACFFIFAAADILYGDTSSCPAPNSQAAAASPSLGKCYELPGADPFLRGIMWLGPPQAVLALALLLAGGGGRRSMGLAVVTVAVTAANHVLFARLLVILCVATSTDTIEAAVVFGAFFFVAAVLLLGLLGVLASLLLGREKAE